MTPLFENIPEELKARPQWVNFRQNKTPVDPKTGGPAKANDPGTWGTFAQAFSYYESHRENGIAGIGYEFSFYDPYCGVDLDKCRDPKTGEIAPWAMAIIERLHSYTEISPSGRGLHIIVKGKLPPGGPRRKGQVEMYDVDRYFTMTGHHLPGTPTIIEDRQAELSALHTEIFGKAQAQPKDSPERANLDLSDQELLDKAHQAANGELFARLWRGDITGYSSMSEATAALLKILVFWCGPDRARIDRLFRQSGLMRDKWDRPTSGSTWGALEIEKAISQANHFYSPPRSKPKITKKGQAQDTQRTEIPPLQTIDELRGLRLTDWGNAERLVALHGKDLRYCFPWEKWFVWDGRRWAADDHGEVKRRAKDVVKLLYAEAAAAQDKNDRQALAQFALRCEAHQRQNSFILSAQSEPGIPVLPDDFDRNPWLFNVANGTLDLKTGALRPHDRHDMITKLAPVYYDPAADSPRWWQFLYEIFNHNEGVIRFLQKAVGYSLTGSTREQCLFILHGHGSNGKSTLLDVLQTLLGDYAKRTSMETFLIKKSGAIPNDVAALRGARLVTAVEADSGRRLAEVLVKEITGGDTITARFLHSEFFEFKPEFKIFLAVNHKPTIRGTDYAIWRRIRLIPFTVTFSDDEKDPDLSRKLKDELPGILKWAVEGCLLWQAEGLAPPPEVQAATQEYREEMDLLADFLAECCVTGPGFSAKAADLYKAYTAWAEGNGEKRPLSQTAFGTSLRERGFERDRKTGGIVWWGIGLNV